MKSIFFILVFVLVACKAKAPAVVTETETIVEKPVKAAIVSEELTAAQKGEAIFNNKCGRCHELFKPSYHTKEDWKSTVDRMQPRAKMSDEDKAFVMAYLDANAK